MGWGAGGLWNGHSDKEKAVDILHSIDNDDSEILTTTEESSEDVEESKNLS